MESFFRGGGGGGGNSLFVAAFSSPTIIRHAPKLLPSDLSPSTSRFRPGSSSFSPFQADTTRRSRDFIQRNALMPNIDEISMGLDSMSILHSALLGDLIHGASTTAQHVGNNDYNMMLSSTIQHQETISSVSAAASSSLEASAHHMSNSLMLSDSSSATADIASAVQTTTHSTPNQLSQLVHDVIEEVELERSQSAASAAENIPITPEIEERALNDVGHDLLIFLTISVIVAPLSSALNISPVLLYLIFGLACGPHGLALLRADGEVGFELGDFGILFLLFVEGLNLSPDRLRELGSFFSLGATQLLLSVGVIFFGFFLGGPLLFQLVSNPNVPIDPVIIQLLEQPVVAFAIAAAGALSSSAFVLPILKEKGWEDRPDGIAALSILLLQDLAVAPLLVVLPLLATVEGGVGNNGADPIALGILAFKATVGFGGVLALASVVLRKVFVVVASSKSSQSFVAASLLVAVGMGVISDYLGLSSTTGAFAAGVLLAESGYRAQIEADIKPFEGILLGVFFVTAGSALDPATVIEFWPTLLVGISSFLLIKFGVIYAGGDALGLTKGDAARVGILLAGGGEFAFVVFNLAKDQGIIPETLGSLLTASVIISMSLTPLLGEVAEYVGKQLDVQLVGDLKEQWFGEEKWEDLRYDVSVVNEAKIQEAFGRFDKDGNGEITAEELQNIFTLVGERDGEGKFLTISQVKTIISRFDDNDDGVLQYEEFSKLWMAKRRSAMSEDSLRRAVVVCGYNEVGQQLCNLLDKANIAGIPYVAFARRADHISAGVSNGARVVYGDGTSGTLIKAAGVEKPTAIAITYKDTERCLSATSCLRDAFPDTPILVRANNGEAVKKFVKAGATEVIVATGSVASGMGQLLGVKRDTRFGGIIEDTAAVALTNLAIPLVNGEALGLVDGDADSDPEETRKLFQLFSTTLSLNEDGKAPLSELVNEILRSSDFFITDAQVKELLGCDSSLESCMIDAEDKYVSFSEFVMLYRKELSYK
mmetsp:Transcript_13032/g.26424  ORF Transcript_13032/g.26424 Transcript_13032/m.26424 type:complete len:996 (+) Transcript_13032:121-3108(+)